MEVPLTYKGEQVGDARLVISDEGIMVQGRIYDTEKAVEILGPSLGALSYGFEGEAFTIDPVVSNVFDKKGKTDDDPASR